MQSSTDAAKLPLESENDVDPLGDEFMVAFTSESSWQITKVPQKGGDMYSWVVIEGCSLTGSNKPGTSQISITVYPNTTGQDRSMLIKFSTGQEYLIRQEAVVLDVVPTLECGWLSEVKSLKVDSNICWNLSLTDEDPAWLDVQSGDFEGDRKLDVKFTENNHTGEENALKMILTPYKLDNKGQKVTLPTTVLNDLTKEITVSQSSVYFRVNETTSVSQTLPDFSEFGNVMDEFGSPYVMDPNSQSIVIDSETEWVIHGDSPDWVSYSDPVEESYSGDTEGVVRKRLSLTVNNVNASTEPKSGVVRLVSVDDENAYREIMVAQKGYRWHVYLEKDGQPVTNMPVGTSGRAELVIDTDGPWVIDDYTREWIDELGEGRMSGVGSSRIAVSSSVWNLEQRELDGNIHVRTGIDNHLTADIDVKKDPFVFKVGENIDADEDRQVKDILKKLPMRNTKEYTINIESSGPWEMTVEEETDDSGWFSISDMAGSTSMPISVQALTANPDRDNDRGLVLNFTSVLHREDGAPLSLQIPVIQEKYVFYLNDYSFPDIPAYLKSGIQLSTVVNCSYDWSVSSSAGVYVTSDKAGSNILESWTDVTYPPIYMNVETNTSKSPKIKTVDIRSGLDGEVKTIEIVQDAFVFDVNSSQVPSGILAYSNNQTYTVPVQSTDEVEWQVQGLDDCNWIIPNKKTGSESGDLTFTVKQNGNTSPSTRTATVKIYNTVSGESKSFTFKQDAYLFNVTAPGFTDFNELNAKNTAAQTFKVKSSDKWTIKESVPAWLDMSQTSGNGAGQEVSVNIKPKTNNFTGSDRSFTFTVDGSYGGVTHQKKMTVKQKHYVFDVAGVEDVMTLTGIDSTTKTMYVKSSGSWTVESSDEDVATVSPENGSASRETSKSCEISISANYTPDSREAEITVQSDDYDSSDSSTSFMKKVISINQPGYIFKVGQTSPYNITSDGIQNKSVTVECSGEWTVSRPATENWLTVTKGSGKFTITATSNKSDGKNDAPDRSAVITVKTTDESASYFEPIKIKVEQAGEKAPANN